MIELDDSKARLQVARVHGWLAQSYWSPGIALPLVERAIRGSHCLGGYADNGDQVAFARMITDHATFGWLADVWVEPQWRGVGLGRRMVDWFVDHPDFAGIRRIMLNTRDAHGVYAAAGFAAPVRPNFLMERLEPGAAERLRIL